MPFVFKKAARALQQHRLGDIGLCSVVATELAFGAAQSGSERSQQAPRATHDARSFVQVSGSPATG